MGGAAVTITTLSSREFNQDAGKAKQAAKAGPVIITDRGRPSHVLLTFAQYKKLTGKRTKIADLLAMPSGKFIEFEAVTLRDQAQPADFF
jgi:prevent-host-death family protein